MERNAYFDNAKFILIFLVVFGHMIQPFITQEAYIDDIYKWFYLFHMPVFIFLAGFFAKGTSQTSFIMKLAKKLLIPYIVFQLLYTGYYFFIGKTDWLTEHLFYPHWSLWFLVSLFCWHMLLIAFKKIKPQYAIPITIGLGVLIGYFDQIGHAFSISRTFVFFPYFLIGYFTSEKQVMQLKNNVVKSISAIFLLAVFVIIVMAPTLPVQWLLQSKPYTELGAEVFGGLGRIGVYTLGLTMGAAVLAWIPSKQMIITPLGARTLYVYLLHGFIVQLFRQFDVLVVNSVIDFFMIAFLSLLIVLVLSARPVMTIWQPLVECSTSFIRKLRKDKKEKEHLLS